MGFSFGFYFFSRIPKKMLVQPTGILPEDYQDYKKKNKKNWDSWDSTKKPVKRFWDSTEKRFFGFQFFSHRIPSFFSGIPGFWTKKSTIFVISATLPGRFGLRKASVLIIFTQTNPISFKKLSKTKVV